MRASTGRIDLLAALAALIAIAMAGVYAAILRDQGDAAPAWVVAVFALGIGGSLYGAARPAPGRRVALFAAGGLLAALGLLAILTIGVPLLLAGAIALVAAARAGPAPSGGPPATGGVPPRPA